MVPTRQTGQVATLLPADFDLTLLPQSEQRVCKAFLLGLEESWIVVPSVPILVDGKDCEIDVVLISPGHGMILVEVKGGVVTIDKGRWMQYDRLIASPVAQVKKAKHQLIARLRTSGVHLEGIFMCHVVALPDVGYVPPEGLGPDAPAEIVLAKAELEFPKVAVNRLLREQGPIPPERITKLLAALRPDIALEGNEGQVLQGAA